MTRDTHLGVALAKPNRVEARAMRIEPESASDRPMARSTIPFNVAGHARFQGLPGSLSVTQDEPRLGIVESGAAKPSAGIETSLGVAAGAELLVVVAIVAGRLTGVRGGRVTDQESRRMEVAAPGRPSDIRSMAGQTVGLDVAGDARSRGCIGISGVLLAKEGGV